MQARPNRPNRMLQIVAAMLPLVAFAASAQADIFQWEYINPADPSQGKRQSTTLAPDGASVDAVRGANLSGRDLTMAYLIGTDLTGAYGYSANLTDADLSQANLTNAHFLVATLTDADFTSAEVRGAQFHKYTGSGTGMTPAQLYSTASYQANDLSGIDLWGNNLAGGNFIGQNLMNANFGVATLTGADFTGAQIRGANFNAVHDHPDPALAQFGTGITPAQLYSTGSYQVHDLQGIGLESNDLVGGNFVDQNLTNARFHKARLTGADFTGAVVRGTDFYGSGITPAQLYSTASYQIRDLQRIGLGSNDLNGGNFATQNLTNADFGGAALTNADFHDANLTDVNLAAAKLTGANFREANLANAELHGGLIYCCGYYWPQVPAMLSGADLTAADMRGPGYGEALFFDIYAADAVTANLIRPNGHISALDLDAGALLVVRDYDGYGYSVPIPIPITVDRHLAMGPGGTLRMVFEADAWDSTISFAPGIPVTLGGTLELTFASDVSLASQIGRTLDLFNWTGVNATGRFQVQVPPDTLWNTSRLYTAGEVTVLPTSSDVTVPPGAWYVAGGLRARSLFVGEDSRLTIAPVGGPSGPVTLNVLSIAGGATLDLTDNAAIVQSSAATKSADLARVSNHLKRGHHGGDWQGTGITSSTAAAANQAAPNSRSLGFADNATLPLGPYTTFRGASVDESSILIAYTRTGDANLDGLVNDDDVTIVGATYAPGVPQPHWALGDFDYNGFVDDDDVTLLGAFYDPSAPPLAAPGASVSAVPEPETVALFVTGLIAIAMAAVVRRKPY
jgi:uncharacterized protein YjbI with pentapeptide repeats